MINIKEQNLFCIYTSTYHSDAEDDYSLGGGIYSLNKIAANGNRSVFFVGFLTNLNELRNQYKIKADQMEVIISELVDKVGKNIPRVLKGSYAIVIVDPNEILLFRDRFSTENLYFRIDQDANSFILSNRISEIKRFISLEVNENVLPKYFILSQIDIGKTFFRGINSLKRSEMLIFNRESSEWVSQNYDDFTYLPLENAYITDSETQLTIGRIIVDNCEEIRNSYPDYKFINSLSGGVDSSFIQVVLKDLGSNEAYTVYYPPPYGTPVREYSSDIANFLNTDHNTVEVESTELIPLMEDSIRNCEVPYVYEGETLLYGMFKRISTDFGKSARVIIFNGNGADTSLGAGRGLMEMKYLSYPGALTFGKLFSKTLLKSLSKSNYFRYKSIIEGIDSNHIDSEFLFTFFDNKETAKIVKAAFNIEDVSHIYDHELEEIEKYNVPLIEKVYRMKIFEYELIRENNIMFQNAKNLGLIVVFPFIDPKLLKYVINIPLGKKIRKLTMKYQIKKMLGKSIPKKYINRKKIGDCSENRSYLQISFQNDERFRATIDEIKKSNYQKYFHFDYDRIFTDPATRSIALKLINFHIWHKTFIDGQRSGTEQIMTREI